MPERGVNSSPPARKGNSMRIIRAKTAGFCFGVARAVDMTYGLLNEGAMGYSGEKAMRFKEAYIRQFNAMEKALIGKMKEREKGIAVRQALTNTLQRSQENERMHGHAYSTYTNAIYKAVFGKNAKQLREDYGIGSQDNLRDRFSVEELSAVQSMEMLVSGLINCGWGYEKIRDFIQENSVKQLAG